MLIAVRISVQQARIVLDLVRLCGQTLKNVKICVARIYLLYANCTNVTNLQDGIKLWSNIQVELETVRLYICVVEDCARFQIPDQ